MSVLNGIRRARGAGYEHRDRRGCLKGTRVILLDKIERWTQDSSPHSLFWLSGLAGTGKSTVARTIAERCFANNTLGASFFFSGDVKDHDDPGIFFPTLAFQLGQRYPEVRSVLVPNLRSNPDIEYESLESQAEKLIIGPLRSADIATVIVVDALDECKDRDSSSKIVSLLGMVVKSAPKVKLFITSRPEPLIKRSFCRLADITYIFSLHDIAQNLINNDVDIRHFLKHGLSELATRHELDDWPTAVQLDTLCKRAAGLFVYAVATVKFLDHMFRTPSERYTIIGRSPHDTTHEGGVKGVHKRSSLDALCASVFQASFANNNTEDDIMVRSVLAAAALSKPPSPPSAIPEMVDLKIEGVMHILESIYSLLELHENPHHPARPFHKLLSDWLTDQERCSDKRFLIHGAI